MAERPLYTLYKNLKAQNFDVPDDYDRFESALTRNGKDGADNRHAIYNNLKAQNFDVPDTYERFYSALFHPVSKDSSRANGGSVPMSAADKARFSAGASAISASAQQTINNVGRYNKLKQRKQKQKNDFGRVNIGTHKTPYGGDSNNIVKDDFAYNTETGKAGTYVTSDSEDANSLADAQQKQAVLDEQNNAYMEAVNSGEIPSALDVRDKNGNYDLQENIGKNGTYLTEEGAQNQLERKLQDAYARKEEIEKLMAEDDEKNGNPLLSYSASMGGGNGRNAKDSDYRNKLATSLSLVKQQIGALEAVKQYPTSSWGTDAWKALDNTAFTAKTWDFGLTDFATMGQMERIKTKMDNNIPLDASDKMLLKSKLGADAAAALEDEKMGKIYRWTKIAGQSLPFMADFFLTGGFGGITHAMERGALKFAAKRGMGKVSAAILKNTGIVAGDVIGSYAMAGTEQALKTGADIMQRHMGTLYQDENGNYAFGTFDENGNLLHEGGESFGKALYKGLTSAMVENYTEKLFGHNYGIKKGAIAAMEKHGMARTAEFFKNIGKKDWYRGSKKWMEKFGINGFGEEVMEEEIGIPLHALLDGDNKFSDLLDPKQQLDIIGGMAISVGSMYAMGAGTKPIKGVYNRAQYYRFKHKVNAADSEAQQLIGDGWANLKDKIDNTTNEKMGGVLAGILRQRDSMSKDQINSAIQYAVDLMKMRGYNIAKTAEMNAKELTGEQNTEQENHEEEIENNYAEGHETEGPETHDIQLEQNASATALANMLGISEEQLLNMSDEELEAMNGQNDKLDQAIYDYQMSTAKYQGVMDNANDKVDMAARQAALAVDQTTDTSRGTVRNATIKAPNGENDYGVYIISGNLVTHDDGSVDISGSDQMILYYDPKTGRKEYADPARFASVGDEVPAEDVKTEAVAAAKEKAIREVAGIIDGKVDVGSQFTVTDADGNEHTYEVLADNGDGTAAITLDGNVEQNPYSFKDLQALKDAEDEKKMVAARQQRAELEAQREQQKAEQKKKEEENLEKQNQLVSNLVDNDGNVVVAAVEGNEDADSFIVGEYNNKKTGAKKYKIVTLNADGTVSKPRFVDSSKVSVISTMSAEEYKQALNDTESSLMEDNRGEENTQIEEETDTNSTPTSIDTNEPEPSAEPNDSQDKDTNNSSSDKENNAPLTLEDGTVVPMLEDGNPDFSKLTAQQTAELYDTQFGEDADGIVSGFVTDAKKALDKAQGTKIKGNTFAEQKAAKAAKDKAIADAQARYDSAVAIRDAYQARITQRLLNESPEFRADYLQKAKNRYRRMVKKDMSYDEKAKIWNETVGEALHQLYDNTSVNVFDTEPRTVEEYVSSNIGPYSLNYEGKDNSKGVKQETGLSRSDFADSHVLAAEGKGETIDHVVHKLWENRPNQLDNASDQDIRNALIGLITSKMNAYDMQHVIENNRIAEAEKEIQDEKDNAENQRKLDEQKAAENAQLSNESNDLSNQSNDLSNETNEEEGENAAADSDEQLPSAETPSDATEEQPLGEQKSENDLPFSAKDNNEQETDEERQKNVERNKVDDTKVVDNVVGKKTRKALERIAKMMGAKIQWQYSDKVGNGWYDNSTNTIYLTLDSSITEGVQFIFGHEMTHEIKTKNPAAFEELKKLVIDTYGDEAYQKAIDETEKKYSDAGFGGRASEYYAEEVVADAIGGMMRDLNYAHTLAMKMSHPLLAKIHEIVNRIRMAFYGTEYTETAKQIMRSIEQAYVKTANGTFESSSNGERFSLKDNNINDVNSKFDNELQQQIEGKLEKGHIYKLGMPSSLLLSTGIPNLPIQLNSKRLNEKATNFWHDFDLNDVKGLVKAIQNPIAIFSYGNKEKAQNLVLEISKDGKNFIVGLSLNPIVGGKHLEINSIRNVFPKDNAEWLNWISQGKSLYLDKGKIQTLIDQQRTNLADVDYLDLDSVAKIIKDFENPSVSEEKLQDDEKFSLKVYHGSGADFTEFDFDHMGEGAGSQSFGWGGYVTSSKKIGKSYATLMDNDPTQREYRTKQHNAERLLNKYPTLEAFLNAPEIVANKKTKEEKVAYYNKALKDAEPYHNLYEVNIPDDNGGNYLDWDAPLSDEQKKAIGTALKERGVDVNAFAKQGFDLNKPYQYINHVSLPMMFNSLGVSKENRAKEISKFLSSVGFTGIKYKAGRNFGGAEEGDTNYVIFKPEDMKIAEHTKFSIRTYHGSQASFDHFDHSFMGSGEGAQAYGWGTYVSEVEGIAKAYAKQNTRKHQMRNDKSAIQVRYHSEEARLNTLKNDRDAVNESISLRQKNINRKLEMISDEEKDLPRLINFFGEKSDEVNASKEFISKMKALVENGKKGLFEYEERKKEIEQQITEKEKLLKDLETQMKKSHDLPERNLYTVEIPDDTGDNYIGWDSVYRDDKLYSMLNKIGMALESKGIDLDKEYNQSASWNTWIERLKNEGEDWTPNVATGKEIYNKLSSMLGDNAYQGNQKAASLVLKDAGFDGVKVIAQRNTGGNKEGNMNYVIFDEDNAKITNHTKFSLKDINPVGKNQFGDVYDQFKGKPKEAFDFLLKNKSGYLTGVFHRDEIGDIDLVYGEAPTKYSGYGLAHIIRKHVELMNDFDSVDDAVQTIIDVIKNGKVEPLNEDRVYEINNGNYRVSVAKDKNGNWVLSAMDKSRSKKAKLREKSKKGAATVVPPSLPSDGAGAVAPNLSAAKIDNSSETSKENGEKFSLKDEKTMFGMHNISLDKLRKAIVPKDTPKDVVDALKKAGIDVHTYEGKEDREKVTMDAINSSDDIKFSLKSMENKPEGWKQANKKAIHIAEAIERDPKFSLKNLDGTLIKAGTYFSGGGLVEEGLKGIIDPVVAVEYDEKISGVYRNNFGQHLVTADVRDVDPKELVKSIDGEVEYFHASPVCKNYSKAKANHEEVELDKETAQSTADFINEVKPKVVTIENVKGYRDSEAMKTITDALDKNGYKWDADVYNAADYGGYTNRERLIVRAVREGELPEKPKKMARKKGWYEAVEDIMPTLTEKKNGVAPWMDVRLKADGIDWRNIDKPLYVMGSAYANGKVPHAFADELLPTLRTKSGDVIVMPNGKVYRANGRVLARVSGVSDDYKMPYSEALSHTIIGNGIPTQLTEHVIAPLLISRDPKFSIRTYHGTGANFDAFDSSHAFEGEGSESFGHGVYVTNSEEIGAEYAKRAKERKIHTLNGLVVPDYALGKPNLKSVINMLGRRMSHGETFDDARQSIVKMLEEASEDLNKEKKDSSAVNRDFDEEIKELREDMDFLNNTTEDELKPKKKANRYDVEIPDDNRQNYLKWHGALPSSLDKNRIIQDVVKGARASDTYKGASDEYMKNVADDIASKINKAANGEQLYNTISWYVGDKNASKILSDNGIVGMKYRAGMIHGSAKENDYNYVIYKDSDAKIVGNTKFSLKQQKEKIVEDAKKNGNYMLAPNGKKTKLDAEQWSNVRTDNFKKWFGDWENDPENASKVVDENGEPMVVYHGRSTDFNTFEKKEGVRFVMGLEDKVKAEGFFFSPDKGLAEEFAGNAARHRGGKANVVPCFLNIRKPLDLVSEDYDKRYEDVTGWSWVVGMDSQDNLWEIMDEEGMADKMKDKGYDGAIFVEEVDDNYEPTKISYCALDANQIKSADNNNGEYSAENNDIRFSLRVDQFEHDLEQWKKDNNLPKDAIRPSIPIREPNESVADFLKRVKEYRNQMALWKTAPQYEGHLLSDDTAQGQFNLELQKSSVIARIALQDSMLAIRKAQEAIMKEVGVDKLNMAEDAYTAENRSHGKGKNEFEEYNDEFLQPLRKAYNDLMKKLGKSYDNVKVYMIAKHGLERNAQMAFKMALENDYEKQEERIKAYNDYKSDMDRLMNDGDYLGAKIDFTTWRQRDNAIRVKYAPSFLDYRYDKMGIAIDYSGLSALFDGSDFEEAAADLVKDVEDKHGHEAGVLWNTTNRATKKILRDGYKAGMMSKEVYEYVRDMYQNYIPLRGWSDTNADQVWNYVGGGKGAFNQTLKEAYGRGSLADDPIAYIENMAESGILLNNKNWVKQHLLLLAQNHPTSLLNVSKAWYVKTTDANGNEQWIPATPQITSGITSKQVAAALDAFQQKMEQLEQKGDATQKREHLEISYPQTNGEEREHEVRVMKDGEEYVIYVNGDPQLAQAMNNTRAHRVREGLENSISQKAIAWLGRKMAAAYTSLSPLFIPSNFFRDTTMTLASTAIREDARYNYLLRKNMLTHWNMYGMVRSYQNGKLREKVRNGKASKTEEMFYDFMMNGGETGFVSSLDVEDLKKKFKNELKDMNRMAINPKKVGHLIMDEIETLNRAIEDSNRFVVYMTSIQYGRSIDEAVNDAKDVTLNFNRKGTGEHGWQTIRNLYLFINPAVQSLQTLGALAKHHPFKFTAVTTAWLASGLLVPMINYALMSMFGGDDDKDKYWSFTKWDRRNNLIMWVPFTHNFVKIPLAQEFRGFYGVGDMIASKLWGGEKAEESWEDYGMDMLGQVVDMMPLDPTGYDGNIAVSLMPNPIRPMFELAFNVDFTGKPLFKDSEYNKYDPNFTKAYAGTPDWLVRISRMVNSVGNDYPDFQQNAIDSFGNPRFNLNNPAVVDHVLSSYLGGAYTMGSQILGVATKALNDPSEVKTADIPLISKFVGNPGDRPVTKKKGDEFWVTMERHDRAANTLSKLKKQAKVDGDYSTLEHFFGTEQYKQYKLDDKEVKKYQEEKKKEKADEMGDESYRPHKTTYNDIYKNHATAKDDFEDMKLSQLYSKVNAYNMAWKAMLDMVSSQADSYYNENAAAIQAAEDAKEIISEMNELKKGFLSDNGKDAWNAEDRKRIRDLRKEVLPILEKANKVLVERQKKAKKKK